MDVLKEFNKGNYILKSAKGCTYCVKLKVDYYTRKQNIYSIDMQKKQLAMQKSKQNSA
jgi:hypothetical protein